VVGVRKDLVMTYVEKPAEDFPAGMAISEQVSEPFLHVVFDVTLAKDN
jgi:hydroxyquinol 1,2-dioxygenase